MTTTDTDLLTTLEVATRLRVNPATARRWCADGTVPAIRVGSQYRVAETDLAAYMAAGRVMSQPLVIGTTR